MGTAEKVSFGEDRQSVIMKQVQHRHEHIGVVFDFCDTALITFILLYTSL